MGKYVVICFFVFGFWWHFVRVLIEVAVRFLVIFWWCLVVALRGGSVRYVIIVESFFILCSNMALISVNRACVFGCFMV